jgi:hypothetical protein
MGLSIYVYFENNRKIIELDLQQSDGYKNFNTKFIEGVGSTNGFYMAENLEIPGEHALLCKYNNGELVYTTSSNIHGNCYLDGGTPITVRKKDFIIEIFPNPSDGQVNISFPELIPRLNYSLYNTYGTQCKSGSVLSSNIQLSIDSKGVFFLIFSNDKDFWVNKIVINGY